MDRKVYKRIILHFFLKGARSSLSFLAVTNRDNEQRYWLLVRNYTRFALGMRSSANAVLIVVLHRHSDPFQAHVLQKEQNGR